jgi:hypothetical protein
MSEEGRELIHNLSSVFTGWGLHLQYNPLPCPVASRLSYKQGILHTQRKLSGMEPQEAIGFLCWSPIKLKRYSQASKICNKDIIPAQNEHILVSYLLKVNHQSKTVLWWLTSSSKNISNKVTQMNTLNQIHGPQSLICGLVFVYHEDKK